MAQGDVTIFNEFVEDLGEEVHNFESDVIKLALIDNVVTPAADTATPQWGVGSSQDYDANEVSTAGGYTANGETVAVTFTRSTTTATLDDNSGDISLAQNGSGFTNAYWGILYNDSAVNKNCIAFVELGGPVSEQAGPVNINWNVSGILTIAVT
jgi:hypothetical protein